MKTFRLLSIILLLPILCAAALVARSWGADEQPSASAEGAPPLNLNFKTRYLFSISAVASDYAFSEIKDLLIDGRHEELFVLDNGNKRVVITGLNGIFLYQFKYVDAGVKNRPVSIAAADDGLLYIAEEKRVVVTSYRGVFKRIMNVSTVPDAAQMAIQSIAVEGDKLYIGDIGDKRVIVLDRKKEEFIAQFKDLQFKDKRSKKTRILKNFYIAVADDALYVNDPANFSIFILDKKDGKPLGAFGMVSSLAGGFSMPIDMTVDRKTGRVLVADWNRLTVIIFDKDGEFLFEIGGSNLFQGPNAVAAYDDRIYVSDGGVIRAFQATEEPLAAAETEPAPETSSAPPPKDEVAKMAEEKARLMPIYFPEGSIEFREADGEILDKNIRWLKENPEANVEVRGYADDRRNEESNLLLSEERAKSAADYMIRRGIDPKRVKTKGYGGLSTGAIEAELPKKRVDFLLAK